MASRLNDPSVLPRSVTGADVPPGAISIHEVLIELVDDIVPVLGPGIPIELQLDAPFSHVRVGRDEFAQAILQLAGIARDAMPRGGRFVIRTSVAPWGDRCSHCGIGDFVVVVSDTRAAVNIPEIPVDVSRILKDAGGSISISSAPGHGASFRIRLPLV